MRLTRLRVLLRAVLDDPAPARDGGAVAGGPDGRVLWAVTAALAALEGLLRDGLAHRWFSVALIAALAGTLTWRRRHPLRGCVVVAAVNLTALVATSGSAPDLYASAVLLVLPASLARWGSGRDALVGAVVLLGSGVAASLVQGKSLPEVGGGLAVLSTALAVGTTGRYRQRARAREHEQVAAAERERIARDLHDTVAHHVSAIAVRAQAGLAVGGEAAATDALRLIEVEARRTLTEMRDVVRALRDGDAPTEPPATLAGLLRELSAQPVASPPRVTVTADGELDAVPAPVQAAAARIVQEAVTNARRHARDAGEVTVAVLHEAAGGRSETPARLLIDVRDDGRPAPLPGPDHPGHGLRGMAERARLLGGELTAGPDGEDGGWRVRALLPWRSP